MTEPDDYTFRRYLDAKRTVDERALDRRVTDRLRAELAEVSPPLEVLEVGPGLGGTIERVLMWDVLPDHVRYTAVDVDPDLVTAARSRLRTLAEHRPFEVHDRDDSLVVDHDGRQIAVDLVARDVFDFVEATDREWDLLIAQAFLDLTDVRSALPTLCSAVPTGGLLYFPITFDGGTTFEPTIDPAFDDQLERRYHTHMDTADEGGDGGGDSRAGRHLLSALPAIGGTVEAAGSSDWVVVPGTDGYPADEAYFLHHIVEMVRGALADDPGLESDRFDRWVTQRHHQIENETLVYIAHQLDVLGRSP